MILQNQVTAKVRRRTTRDPVIVRLYYGNDSFREVLNKVMCSRKCKDCRTYWCKRDEIYVCTGICEGRKAKGRCGKTCATLNPTIRKTATERLVNKHKRSRKEKVSA